jgi:UDP-N-acetylglucosamine 2-epimerase (non-hydrolysing)
MTICLVGGTRPELIKLLPVLDELRRKRLDFFVIHTGQHYSRELSQIFFEELGIPEPEYNLKVGSGTHAEQTAESLKGIESVLLKEKPEFLLMEGDTNSALAGALAAAKLDIFVGHIEAGLRSWERDLPEELNRTLIDHCSDLLFAPTTNAKNNLIHEGIADEKIWVTGNTIIDAVQRFKKQSLKKGTHKKLGFEKNRYFLITLHRSYLIDKPNVFKEVLRGVKLAVQKFGFQAIFPVHPRSEKILRKLKMDLAGITVIPPLGYLDFLELEQNAALIFTDSGGIQEEACYLRVPVVTLRKATERPESVDVGANMVSGWDAKNILRCTDEMMKSKRDWVNPFGDGKAGKKIVEVIETTSQQKVYK